MAKNIGFIAELLGDAQLRGTDGIIRVLSLGEIAAVFSKDHPARRRTYPAGFAAFTSGMQDTRAALFDNFRQ
jgi:hypothetical protein